MVGGVTYEEAKEVSNFWNQEEPSKQAQIHQLAGQALGTLPAVQNKFNIILGGTFVHNSKTFLADVSRIREGADLQSFELG